VACPGIVRTNFPDRAAYVNVDKEAYLKRLPWRLMMEPAEAAQAILRGVVRNQAIIVCPWHGRLLWWCQRHFPWLLSPLWRMTVREWRTLRMEETRRRNVPVEPAGGSGSPTAASVE
jgi:short-subunit dehydrogenase